MYLLLKNGDIPLLCREFTRGYDPNSVPNIGSRHSPRALDLFEYDLGAPSRPASSRSFVELVYLQELPKKDGPWIQFLNGVKWGP